MKDLTAIKRFFDRDGKVVGLDELKKLSENDKVELGNLAREQLLKECV